MTLSLPLRLWPRSIVGQTALVLVGGVVAAIALALILFAGQRSESLRALGGRNIAERLVALVVMADETPPQNRRHTLMRMDTPLLRTGWSNNPLVADTQQEGGLAAHVAHHLRQELEGREIRVGLRALPPPPPPADDGGPPHGRGRGLGAFGFTPGPIMGISVQLSDGTWLNAVTPIDPGEPLWRLAFVLPLLGMVVLVIAIALWMVRRATRPFGLFAAAASRLGMDVTAPPMAESGPSEVHAAAHAFNVMQSRIRRFVEDRTQMLAAISHDLRTPITRMKLRAEFIDDDGERDKMLADLDEMERMIAATLAFARDDAAHENRRPLDVASLVQGIADDCNGQYQGPDSLVLDARPLAMKRALTNLAENAVKYGGCVTMRLDHTPQTVTILVEDQGPGIPVDQQERVFSPFVRLESSRNRETGGSGLGLSIARAAIRAHGGDIALVNPPQGGLQVVVTLPRS